MVVFAGSLRLEADERGGGRSGEEEPALRHVIARNKKAAARAHAQIQQHVEATIISGSASTILLG